MSNVQKVRIVPGAVCFFNIHFIFFSVWFRCCGFMCILSLIRHIEPAYALNMKNVLQFARAETDGSIIRAVCKTWQASLLSVPN